MIRTRSLALCAALVTAAVSSVACTASPEEEAAQEDTGRTEEALSTTQGNDGSTRTTLTGSAAERAGKARGCKTARPAVMGQNSRPGSSCAGIESYRYEEVTNVIEPGCVQVNWVYTEIRNKRVDWDYSTTPPTQVCRYDYMTWAGWYRIGC